MARQTEAPVESCCNAEGSKKTHFTEVPDPECEWYGRSNLLELNYDDTNIDPLTLECVLRDKGELTTLQMYKHEVATQQKEEEEIVLKEAAIDIVHPIVWTETPSLDALTNFKTKLLLTLRKILVGEISSTEFNATSGLLNILEVRDILEKQAKSKEVILNNKAIKTIYQYVEAVLPPTRAFMENVTEAIERDLSDPIMCPPYDKIIADLPKFDEYMKNMVTIKELIADNGGVEQVDNMLNLLVLKPTEPFSVMLQRPEWLRYRVYYEVRELIKFTPQHHEDNASLRRVLEFLKPVDTMTRMPNYALVKSGYAVHLLDQKRYLCYLFLFPNFLFVTRPSLEKNEVRYKPYYSILLDNDSIKAYDMEFLSDVRTDDIRRTLHELQKTRKQYQFILDMAKCMCRPVYKWQLSCWQKTLFRFEYELTLLVPSLRLIIQEPNGHKNMFLFSSLVELLTWKDLISNSRCGENSLLHTSGTLSVYVHQIRHHDCTLPAADTYVTLEVDSFNGFYAKVYRTKVVKNSIMPVYDEEFTIPTVCSRSLKVSVFRSDSGEDGFKLILAGIFDLWHGFLNESYKLVTIPLLPSKHKCCVAVSLKIAENKRTPRRNSDTRAPFLRRFYKFRERIFGEQLSVILAREETDIPMIVSCITAEIEARVPGPRYVYVQKGKPRHLNQLISICDICILTGSMLIHSPKLSPCDLGDLLLYYLSHLPSPLLTQPDMFNCLLYETENTKCKTAVRLFNTIQKPERDLLYHLIQHLATLYLLAAKQIPKPDGMIKVFASVILMPHTPSFTNEEFKNKTNVFTAALRYLIQLRMHGISFDEEGETTEDQKEPKKPKGSEESAEEVKEDNKAVKEDKAHKKKTKTSKSKTRDSSKDSQDSSKSTEGCKSLQDEKRPCESLEDTSSKKKPPKEVKVKVSKRSGK